MDGAALFMVTNHPSLKGDAEKYTGEILGFLRIFLDDSLAREKISRSLVGRLGGASGKRFLSSRLGNDMKELKAMEGFSVTLGKGDERMLLVFISMMLSGDTLQLACSCSRIEARVCPYFMLFSDKVCSHTSW